MEVLSYLSGKMVLVTNFSAGTAVTISGAVTTAIPVPASTQTLVSGTLAQSSTSFTVNVESAALLTLTPTAGKTLYLCGASGFTTNSGQNVSATIYDSTTARAMFGLSNTTASAGGDGYVNFPAPIKITTNANIKCFASGTATVNVSLCLYGYEVTT